MCAGSCAVRGALRAALSAGRVVGVAPLRMTREPRDTARVTVSHAATRYCCAVTTVCTGAVLVGEAYSIYRAVSADGAAVAHSLLWYVIGASDMVLTALIVSVHGWRGARRMTRLIRYVQQIETVNAASGIEPARGGGLAGEAGAWVLLAVGAALALFSHVFYSTLIVINNNQVNMSTLVSFVFVYVQLVVKAVLALEYASLTFALAAAARGLRARLAHLAAELGLKHDNSEDDDDAYVEALASVRNIKQSYLTLHRLLQRFSRHEGAAVLVLLAGNTYKMMSYIYVATSAYYSHVADGLIPETIIIIVLSMTWVLFELVKTTALVEPCHRTSDAMRGCRVQLSALLLEWRRGERRGELEDALQMLDLQPTSLSPLDICPIRRSLLAAIIGGCSTFLVIMRQFNLKDNGVHV